MASLKDLSNELADLVERAGRSVVRVDARRGRSGSGIVWGDDLVLTADHVVEQEDSIEVAVGDRPVKATVAGRDPSTDIALLRAGGLGAPAAPRVSSQALKVGHLVMAIGRPDQLRGTLGVITSLAASVRSWRGGDLGRLIETDVELLPGFSGGPLVDADGRVIGVNSWHLGRGVSRALPVDAVDKVVDSLKTHGRIRRPYLGVGTQPVTLPEPVKGAAGQEGGLLVATVEDDGPAGKAGLLQGDTLVALDASRVQRLDDLFSALLRLEVGSTHTLKVVRAGEIRELTVTLGERGH